MNMKKASVLILAILFLMIACENPSKSNYDPPASHTISKDGYLHMTGLNDPATNCNSCHGDDLRGGSTGVSCYECHGKKW